MRSFLCASVLGAWCIPCHAQDPVIQAIVNGTDIDSLMWNLERLTGAGTVDVGAGSQSIDSRHKLNPGNALAADWLQQRFADYGYSPTVQVFSGGTGENVIAEKTGAVHPGRKVVLCGHYDAMPAPPAAAPAADDDGSGTVAVLEAARLFSQYQFENTVVFALWDEEEQGKVGSAWYAGIAAANDDTLLAVVNMDAIAYDGDGDDLMRVHTRNIANSLALKDTAVMVNTLYGIGLPMAINDPGATYSDHASFWNEGYGAILVIEDFDNDGNPHYHTPTDVVAYIDQPYFQRLAQLSFATAATMAVPYTGGTGAVEATRRGDDRLRAWPVPSSGIVRLLLPEAMAAPVQVSLLDATGRTLWGTTAIERSVTFDLSGLPAGPYCVRAIDARSVAATTTVVRVP